MEVKTQNIRKLVNVFEKRKSTGSEVKCILGQWCCPHFRLNRFYNSKDVNVIASRHIKREKLSPVVKRLCL